MPSFKQLLRTAQILCVYLCCYVMSCVILFYLVLASGIPAYASNRSECRQGRGSVVRKIRGFEIRISPYPDKSNPDLDECEAEIYDPRGDVIFSEHDWGFAIQLAADSATNLRLTLNFQLSTFNFQLLLFEVSPWDAAHKPTRGK